MYSSTIFDELFNLNREMNRIFNSDAYRSEYWPSVNIYENGDEYRIVAKVPGVEKDKINITLKDNSLKLKGTRIKEEGDNRAKFLDERFTGDFERSFILNEKIDSNSISAEIKNGLLMIMLPKSPESKPKEIEIK